MLNSSLISSQLSQPSQTQSLPCAQPRQSQQLSIGQTLKKESEAFLASLIARNNANNEDLGVHSILIHLGKENPRKLIKADKSLKKDQLLAGLGFLFNLSLQEAKDKFKGIKVDQIQEDIMKKFNLENPDICRACNKIYMCQDNELGDSCLLCTKKLCPACCPKNSEDSGYLKVVFPISHGCSIPLIANRAMENYPEAMNNSLTEGLNVSDLSNNSISQGDSNSNRILNSSMKIPPQDTEDKVCKFYLRKACRHVRDKTSCKYKHPKV